jgi:hypothetical protein
VFERNSERRQRKGIESRIERVADVPLPDVRVVASLVVLRWMQMKKKFFDAACDAIFYRNERAEICSGVFWNMAWAQFIGLKMSKIGQMSILGGVSCQ